MFLLIQFSRILFVPSSIKLVVKFLMGKQLIVEGKLEEKTVLSAQ